MFFSIISEVISSFDTCKKLLGKIGAINVFVLLMQHGVPLARFIKTFYFSLQKI